MNRALEGLGNDLSQGCLAALCPVHRLPSWEPNAEGAFAPRWSLWAPHSKIVEGQIWTGRNQSAPAGLVPYRHPQDPCSVFYLELLLFSWLHCVLISSCQLIYRQHSPSTVCTLWGSRNSPGSLCDAHHCSAATFIVLLKGECPELLNGTWARELWAAHTQTFQFSFSEPNCSLCRTLSPSRQGWECN